jgi:hypothetical protein
VSRDSENTENTKDMRPTKRAGDAKHVNHPGPERLIDFVDGDLSQTEARRVEEHIASCTECRAYADSLKAVFALAAEDKVPEQPEAYWADFGASVARRIHARKSGQWQQSQWPRPSLAGRILQRALGGRRRLALVLSPGVAVAIAVLLMLSRTQAPPYVVENLEPPLEVMTTGEIARSMAGDAVFDDMFIEAAGEDISSIEQYLDETGNVDDLLQGLGDEEQHDLALRLSDIMKQQGTQILKTDSRESLS